MGGRIEYRASVKEILIKEYSDGSSKSTQGEQVSNMIPHAVGVRLANGKVIRWEGWAKNGND
jgi:hypothetical protein